MQTSALSHGGACPVDEILQQDPSWAGGCQHAALCTVAVTAARVVCETCPLLLGAVRMQVESTGAMEGLANGAAAEAGDATTFAFQ